MEEVCPSQILAKASAFVGLVEDFQHFPEVMDSITPSQNVGLTIFHHAEPTRPLSPSTRSASSFSSADDLTNGGLPLRKSQSAGEFPNAEISQYEFPSSAAKRESGNPVIVSGIMKPQLGPHKLSYGSVPLVSKVTDLGGTDDESLDAEVSSITSTMSSLGFNGKKYEDESKTFRPNRFPSNPPVDDDIEMDELKNSCHALLTTEEGVIKSPEYPANYPPNLNCIYDIVRSNQDFCAIRFTFEFFRLEPPDQETFCKKDWLSIDSCVPEGGARFCGNISGAIYEYPFQHNADAFRLVFHSDNSTTGPGFRVAYKLLNDCKHGLYWDPPVSLIPGLFPTNIPCFTQVTERKGTINTPYYPKTYPENMDCVYEFIRESPFTCGIKMKVISFELEKSIDTQLGGACLDFFHMPGCGFLWTAKFQPGATSLRFHFHSDEEVGLPFQSGFQIAFEQIYDCSGTDSPTPNIPLSYYRK